MSSFDIQKKHKLARKSAWGTGILTLFLPFAGYLYTGRYRLAMITLIIWLPLTSASDSNKTASDLLGFLMIGTCVENVVTVLRAKGTAQNITQQGKQQYETNDLRVKLLKLAQQKGEVTLADCVIATQGDIDEIRAILSKLELADLMRSGNRASDGAVVYRVV
ncbi:MAG TPA: hypothetical protein V6D10_01010 [Trichocoleus sp.]|jgi:hypothetical protein